VSLPEESKALLDAFESCTLAPSSFGHREHVHVAWAYLRLHPFAEAAMRFERSLKNFAETHGALAKIDLPLTWAYLGLIAETLRANDASFDALVARRPDLLERRLSRAARAS
jgi:hypothetical protein